MSANSHSSQARQHLDQLFAIDAGFSFFFGILAFLAPHGILVQFTGGLYNHNVHETLRLYGCLRMACGYILWHVRKVDDGIFRRHVCEALLVCYALQALSVARAQLTDRHTWLNWFAIAVLSTLGGAYGAFRFRKGGNLIKVYELPTSALLE